jgi:uncharacterized protein YwgA
MAEINNRKDILLLLLYLPGAKGKNAEPISGRTRLMKLLYLLSRNQGIDKILEIRNYYKYEAYDYGPFSKDVFEDVEFLRNVGLIESNPEETSNPIDRWEDYQLILESVGDPEKEEFETPYQEELFTLTEKGINFVEKRLLPSLSEDVKNKILSIKANEGAMSLTSLLRYVYTKYPESAKKTKLSHLVPKCQL